MSIDSTARFSNRVADYVNYRPSYPREIVAYMHGVLGVDARATVADVGSGTGIFTQLLLEAGHTVYAIEPNGPMREAAQKIIKEFPGFISVAATAEQTTLDDASVDVVTAAQAFHWFDVPAARSEFKRILRPAGWVVLLWNDRREDQSSFSLDYQALIDRYNTDLSTVDHRRLTRTDEVIRDFFGRGGFRSVTFDNHQSLDFDGLRGRLVSSSYIPAPDAPGHDAMIADLTALFERHAVGGEVRITYDTKVYYGRLEEEA
jgi:ubiquinone/menaquinone biosynthesis C-methylase UbiE